jgi:hypothetical protein
MPTRTYEITFTGQAGPVLRAEFEDCQVITGPRITTLRAEIPDSAALTGLIQRVCALGLDVTGVRRLASPADDRPAESASARPSTSRA